MLMKNSRVLFGKHKQGYVFPMLLNTSALETCFVGVMQKITSNDEFLWFYSKSLQVVAGSLESLMMMGVSVNFVLLVLSHVCLTVLCAAASR